MNNGSELSGLNIGVNGVSLTEMRNLERKRGKEYDFDFGFLQFEMPMRPPNEIPDKQLDT